MARGGESAPRLIAAISAYDEADLLPGCLASLKAVDRIVVVDGAFADYPHESPTSTDGMLEWLEAEQQVDSRIELVTTTAAWPDEMSKRSAYLVGDPGDWYLVIDADERLYSGADLKTFLRTAEDHSYLMPFFDKPTDPAPMPAGRVFRHLDGIHYEVGDGRVVAGGRILVNADTADATIPWREGVPSPRLLHMQHKRSPERQAKREEYIRRVLEQNPDLAAEVERSGVDVLKAWRERQSG